MPEAGAGVHDHQVPVVDNELANSQVVVPHDAARHPRDDLVVRVFVQADVRAWFQRRFNDEGQGTVPVIARLRQVEAGQVDVQRERALTLDDPSPRCLEDFVVDDFDGRHRFL